MDAGVQQGVRRSATLPTQFQTRAVSNGASANATQDPSETIFHHPHAKIIKIGLHTVLPSSNGSSARWHSPEIAGTLPWKTSSERIIAVGPLVLYRLTQSPVAFIQSGNALLPLRPRSQCWCVDGESRFAICIMDDIFRIDLPFESEEDKAYVESMKVALSQVLKYEKTACPFRRGFTVDLPEEPDSLIPRGPAWSHIKLRKSRVSEPAQSLRTDEGKESESRIESSGQSEDDEIGVHNRALREGSPDAQNAIKPAIPKRANNRVVTAPVRQRVADPNASAISPVPGGLSSPPLAEEKQDSSVEDQPQIFESNRDALDEIMPHNNAIAERVTSDDIEVEQRRINLGSIQDSEPFTPPQLEQTSHSVAKPLKNTQQPMESSDKLVPDHAMTSTNGLSIPNESPANQIEVEKASIENQNLMVDAEKYHGLNLDGTPLAAPLDVEVEDSIPHIVIKNDSSSSIPAARSHIEEQSPEDLMSDEAESAAEAQNYVKTHSESLEVPLSESVEAEVNEPSMSEPGSTNLQPPPKSEKRLASRRSYGRISPSLPPTNPQGLVSRSLAVLLGPPSGLVQVMLEIARRIAQSSKFAGLYRFKLGSRDDPNDEVIGRWYKLPGAWISDDDEIDRAMGEDRDVPQESAVAIDLERESEEDSGSEHSDFDTTPTTNTGRDEASATRRKMHAVNLDG